MRSLPVRIDGGAPIPGATVGSLLRSVAPVTTGTVPIAKSVVLGVLGVTAGVAVAGVVGVRAGVEVLLTFDDPQALRVNAAPAQTAAIEARRIDIRRPR